MKPFVEVHETRPDNFSPTVEVAACRLEVAGKFLLLEAAPRKKEAKTWGLPAGKMESGETPVAALVREIFEETAILIDLSELRYIAPFYIRKPDFDFVFHLFHVKRAERPLISLSEENTNYCWVDSSEIEELPLLSGAREIHQLCQKLL